MSLWEGQRVREQMRIAVSQVINTESNHRSPVAKRMTSDLPSASQPVLRSANGWGGGKKTLTQDVGGPVPGDEARVVPVARPFLQDAFAEIFAEAAARSHQAVVATVSLRESANDSSGNQSAVRQHGQHHPHTSPTPKRETPPPPGQASRRC